MTQTESPTVLATISPSPARRGAGITVLAALGGLLLYLGLAEPPAALTLQGLLLVLGIGGLALAEALRRATAGRLELTAEMLRDDRGHCLARLDNVLAVERGAFAAKPSNGFLLRLAASEGQNRWAPGLWWRFGRRVGVGGITGATQTKAVAEIISALLAERSADTGGRNR